MLPPDLSSPSARPSFFKNESMTYQVLSLKWRPQSFGDVVGQDHVTQTLLNAFKKDRVAQGYILTGSRGVGKTTTARIIAKALNCPNTKDGVPCNDCNNCQEITDGRNLDVLEIDGASNRGIEEIRNLREQIKYSPMSAPYKIFIIDEVHMLTNQAFNALLRTLEEPPSHGKFILATTDIHKVPSTIISRCQRFDFNRITEATIGKQLSIILASENIKADEESINAIARKADGSMRDGLSLMDQVIAYAGESIKIDDVSAVIGLIPLDVYFSYSTAIIEKDNSRMMGVLQSIRTTGFPLEDVAQGLNHHFRNLIVGSVKNGEDLLDLNEDHKRQYIDHAALWNGKDLLRVIQLLNELEYSLKRVTQPVIHFEMTAMKLLEMDTAISIGELLSGAKPKGEKKNPELVEIPAVAASRKTQYKPLKEKSSMVEEEKVESPSPPVKDAVKQNSEISLKTIKKKWMGFVAKITEERPTIGTALEHSEPAQLDGNKLIINVYDLPKFSVGNLNRNNQVIEQFVEEYYGIKIKFKAELEDQKGSTRPSPTMDETPPSTIAHSENGDMVVSRVLEVFDGEILR